MIHTLYFVCTCRYNVFKGCPKAKTCTIILRGGAEQFTEETERSLHDAIMIVRRAIKVSGHPGFIRAQGEGFTVCS